MVAPANVFACEMEPPVGIGSVVRLNSGGPRMLVVDIEGDDVTVAWRATGKTHESVLPLPCVHRCRDI